MVVIRLARRGSKNRPFYQIVVTDKRAPRDGRFIEIVGFLNPLLLKENKNYMFLNIKSINKWIKNGAQLSDTVERLFNKIKKKSIKRNSIN